jgi:hypothetical protein
VARLLKVVDQKIWLYIQAENIWGINEKLEINKEKKFKKDY